MKNKSNLPRRFWPALIIFSLVGQIAWVVENMYLNVFIYNTFKADPSAISLMVAASAVAATVTTMLIGALSDKLGKRKIFICGGYIAWGLSIMSFALLRVDILSSLFPTVSAISLGIALTIAVDCIMTFFGSSANDAAFNAWLTDATDSGSRGAAEGLNAMMPLIAILAVFGGFMAFDLEKAESWTAIFLIIGGAVLVIGILGFFLITDTAVKKEENSKYFANLFYGFRPSVVKENPSLYITLISFALFGISIQIFMPYLILYYDVSLGLDNYVLIMAPAVILASIVTAFYGRVYDKVGYYRSVYPSLAALCLGYVLLALSKNVALVFVGSLLMMCGYLSSSAVFGAMIRDKTPSHKAGMFQGLRIVSQVLIPGVIGPAIGAFVLKDADVVINADNTTSFIPNRGIFVAALGAAVVVTVFIILTAKKEKKHV